MDVCLSAALPSYLKNTDGTPDDDSTLGVDIADLDGDGLLDIVTGQGESGQSFVDRVYFGHENSKPDITPPAFRKVEQVTALPDEPTVVRFGVRDRVTSETGEHVKSVTLSYEAGSSTETHARRLHGRRPVPRGDPCAAERNSSLKVSLSHVRSQRQPRRPKTFELLVGTAVEPEPDAGVEPDASAPEPVRMVAAALPAAAMVLATAMRRTAPGDGDGESMLRHRCRAAETRDDSDDDCSVPIRASVAAVEPHARVC